MTTNDDVWRALPVRPTGPHKRRAWTPRALRRMMRDPGGAGGCDGPRPPITIIVPGELGTSGEAKDLPDCVDVGWYDAPAQTLLKALGFTRDDGVSFISKPHGTKHFYLGVLRGRWYFSGYLYSRSREHGYPSELPELAAFINQIQAATGCCAPVYGDRNPAHRAYWRRPRAKLIPVWRYYELAVMVREAEERRDAAMEAPCL
jgi:hypothetical protein